MFRVGSFPQGWKESVLAPIPKVEGTKKALEHRPLCMMEVLRNACVGDIMRRIAAVWKREATLDGVQYAFQEQKGVEGPLRIGCAVAEDAYLHRKRYCAATQDISKAYDKVERTIGKEMAMRRMGVDGGHYPDCGANASTPTREHGG